MGQRSFAIKKISTFGMERHLYFLCSFCRSCRNTVVLISKQVQVVLLTEVTIAASGLAFALLPAATVAGPIVQMSNFPKNTEMQSNDLAFCYF